eukprot:TRINITY_DN40223_c0_g1_i1.p1 TRINITY_DN40223_c0_g1~~TRINITY_DN40223_c0_g1_i1.p1  ORF type:complete len:1048 (-),score=201.24 TRINITY_DN40223_c0_g1_i1:97-3168(-)
MDPLSIGASVLATGYANYDIAGLSSSIYETAQGNKVDQEFQKRLSAIDFKIQRQSLHREDLRDLMELTVGRMDIYHVVGTLLLTFCITWFVDNAVLNSPTLPAWYITLFLINNFGACGYLLLSVWLAMHASIASHSVSVRLLTSYARLSIPTKKQLDEISIPIFPAWKSLMDKGKVLMNSTAEMAVKFKDSPDKLQEIKDAMEAFKAFDVMSSVRGLRSAPAEDSTASAAAGVVASAPAAEGVAADEEDDQAHFRRFLKEQRRWLCYDAYSRVCMSFGVNQMLEALAYFTLGVVWDKSPVAASVSLLAIKLLGILLMNLDSSLKLRAADVARLFFFYLLPPVFAGTLLWIKLSSANFHAVVRPCASVVFCLKAGWLVTLQQEVGHHADLGNEARADYSKYLPQRLRTVQYLDVLSLEQQKVAQVMQAEAAGDSLIVLSRASEILQQKMREAMHEESCRGGLSSKLRNSDEIMSAHQDLEAKLVQTRLALAGKTLEPAKDAQLLQAQRCFQYYSIWAKTPEIASALKALRSSAVQTWLPEDQNKEMEASVQKFLQKCQDSGFLGIREQLGGSLNGEGTTPGTGEDTVQRPVLEPLQIAQGEEQNVRVEGYSDFGMAESVYLDGANGSIMSEESFTRSTSFNRARAGLNQWQADLEALPVAPPRRQSRQSGGIPGRDSHHIDPSCLASLLPVEATPCDELPGRITKIFTLGTALWWALAALVNLCWLGAIDDVQPPKVSTTMVSLSSGWPEPHGFFKIDSLHCNSSQLWLTSPFSFYETRWLSESSIDTMSDLGDIDMLQGGVSAVLCDSVCCSVLSFRDSSWFLVPLPSLSSQGCSSESEHLPLPSSWRLATATWMPCSHGSLCEDKAWVAGWDGSGRVIVATLQRQSRDLPWRFRQRFQVDPSMGRCSVTDGSSCTEEAVQTAARGYSNSTRALQFSQGGQKLSVLIGVGSNSFIDTWDLQSSHLLGRWHLDGEYTTMCTSGEYFLLSRQGYDGPVLEAAVLSSTVALPRGAASPFSLRALFA